MAHPYLVGVARGWVLMSEMMMARPIVVFVAGNGPVLVVLLVIVFVESNNFDVAAAADWPHIRRRTDKAMVPLPVVTMSSDCIVDDSHTFRRLMMHAEFERNHEGPRLVGGGSLHMPPFPVLDCCHLDPTLEAYPVVALLSSACRDHRRPYFR